MGLIEERRTGREGGSIRTEAMEQMLLYSPKQNEELSRWRINGMRCGGGRHMNPYHQPTMEGGRSSRPTGLCKDGRAHFARVSKTSPLESWCVPCSGRLSDRESKP